MPYFFAIVTAMIAIMVLQGTIDFQPNRTALMKGHRREGE
jgi:hypothetical protein